MPIISCVPTNMSKSNMARPGRSQDIFSQGISQPQSQHHQSQRSVKENNVDVTELANDVLLFFLNHHYLLKPVKKSIMTKYFKNLGSVKIFNDVMGRVKENLDEVMGLEIVENEDGKTTEYFLVNSLIGEVDLTIEQKHVFEDYKLVLLYLILIVIHKNGNRLKEEPLLEFLKNANIIKDVKKPIAGGYFKGLDVDKFICQELITAAYLNCKEIEIHEDADKELEYSWGVRADKEVSVEKLEEFFDQVDSIDIVKEESANINIDEMDCNEEEESSD